jgi:hypothetical protein
MVTAGDLKMTAGIGESALLYILDPGPIDAKWHLILAFASGGTSVAPYALAIVNDEAVVHKVFLPRCETRTGMGYTDCFSRQLPLENGWSDQTLWKVLVPTRDPRIN